MGLIKQLDGILIDKIAAGEVVERPASVVKELVENALDAGASHIEINLDDGGLSHIEVSDNGSGMDENDIKMCLSRHATSKIVSDEDLFQLSTMGFRGEALASVASVSKMKVQSSVGSSDSGKQIRVEGGSQFDIESWPRSKGTSVVVDDLFYNIPARKEFLKSASVEYAHILEWVHALALSRLDAGFKLSHNGKVTFECTVEDEGTSWEDSMKPRLNAVLKKFAPDLVACEGENEYASLKAFISPPGVDRSHSQSIFLFINGRWIQNKSLKYALTRAYHSHLLKGRFPVVVLFLDVNPSLVDVNVHPAKTEVRLQYQSEMQNLISMTIRSKIREGGWAHAEVEAVSSGLSETIERKPLAQSALNFGASNSNAPRMENFLIDSPNRPVIPTSHSLQSDNVDPFSVTPSKMSNHFSTGLNEVSKDQNLPHWDDLNYIGSFLNCYLMFEVGEQMLILDQHAFHERILYENLLKDKNVTCTSQPLLIPETVDLRPTQIAILDESKAVFETLGFKYERIAADSIEVKAVPAFLSSCDLEGLLTQLATQVESGDLEGEDSPAMHQVLSTMACHAAIRAGEPLSIDRLSRLFNEASGVDFWHNCPHGRPVLKWWKKRDVESWFARV